TASASVDSASRPRASARRLGRRTLIASTRRPRNAWRRGMRQGPARARSCSAQCHPNDAAGTDGRVDALHAVHQLAHQKETASVLTLDVVGGRGILVEQAEVE